jgi:hypothetical protein
MKDITIYIEGRAVPLAELIDAWKRQNVKA